MLPSINTKMRDGREVRAQTDFGKGPPPDRKFLIVVQYYLGDIEEAEDLCSIIADLERVRNKDADILLFGRHDAPPIPAAVKAKLETKFDRVHTLFCRNRDSKSYPTASNNMFYDLVTLLGQYKEWKDSYFAFINLETDCVPVHPGWIKQLIVEFKTANVHGAWAIGHFQPNHVMPHMNGVAVYSIDIFDRVPGGKLRGGAPQVAYDMYHGKNLMPISSDTPLIMMEFRRATITAEDLFRPWKAGVEPAIWHGVKDRSARQAVKARHITFSEKKDLARNTIFTYYDTQHDIAHAESNEILELWRQGWLSRGWNPIILRLTDASRHPRYREMCAAVERLPYAGNKQRQLSRFVRWLALDSVGGGVLVENDMMPAAFTPDRLTDKRWIDLQIRGEQLGQWIQEMIAYAPQPEDLVGTTPSVSDSTIINRIIPVSLDLDVKEFGAEDWEKAQIVHFTEQALISSPKRGKRKSDVIQQYLRGEL